MDGSPTATATVVRGKAPDLAATDVKYLSSAIIEYYQDNSEAGIDSYSERCLRRIWRAERFSWWFTMLLHRFPDQNEFDQRAREAELDYLASSEFSQASFCEQYAGLPF